MKLAGKKALVTGASRGIGRGIALAFAAEGADIAVGYRREKAAAEATVRAVEAQGRRAFAYAADVRDGAAVREMVHSAHAALGGSVVLAAGAIALRVCRQPVRRARLVVLTMLGVETFDPRLIWDAASVREVRHA